MQKEEKIMFLLFAALFCGFLSAVKYPLIFFLLLPLTVLWRVCREQSFLKKAGISVLLLAVFTGGFLMCSPRVIFDPYYVLRVIQVESGGYVKGGNLYTLGGWYNHVASVLVYNMLYSGFPFAGAFLAYDFLRFGKHAACQTEEEVLFRRLLPIAIVVFITYNMFAVSLFMRSCYPFFFLGDLYVADCLSELFTRKSGKWRPAICILTAVMLGRGAFFVAVLSEKNSGDRLNNLILQAQDENWSETTLLATWPLEGSYLSFDRELLVDAEEVFIQDERFHEADSAKLRPGEMAISGTEEFSRSNRYMLPYDNERIHDLIGNWECFKETNRSYFIGQVYPEYYYYLFGFWIKGTTGTDYELPTNYVYYRSE